MNRKVVEDNNEASHNHKEMVEATDKSAESTPPTAVIRRGHSTLPEYKIDSLAPTGLQPKTLKGKITFHDVTFAYPTRLETKVFEHFNLTMEPGKSVAICGPSVSENIKEKFSFYGNVPS